MTRQGCPHPSKLLVCLQVCKSGDNFDVKSALLIAWINKLVTTFKCGAHIFMNHTTFDSRPKGTLNFNITFSNINLLSSKVIYSLYNILYGNFIYRHLIKVLCFNVFTFHCYQINTFSYSFQRNEKVWSIYLYLRIGYERRYIL